MAYDTELAARIRHHLAGRPGLEERRMFGGLAFLVHGHMACGVSGDELMLRLGNDGTDAALEEPHTRPMDFTGRVIRSMLFVDPAGLRDDDALARWVDQAVAFVGTLPPKR